MTCGVKGFKAGDAQGGIWSRGVSLCSVSCLDSAKVAP